MATAEQKRQAREWTTLTGHSTADSVISTVGGFDRYHETLRSLPILEQIKLGLLTAYIIESYRPGHHPITAVEAIGHADRDFARGPKFEMDISLKRALDAKQTLNDAVARSAPIQILKGPSPKDIRWLHSGVGAAEPHPDNIRARKTPQNMNETDRRRNRRVEIVMTHGAQAIPGGQDQLTRIFLTLLEAMAFGKQVPPLPPPPPHPPTKPPGLPPWFWNPKVKPERRTSDYEKLKAAVEEALAHIDTDTVLNSINQIRERLNQEDDDEKWLHDFMKDVEEDIRRDREKKKDKDVR